MSRSYIIWSPPLSGSAGVRGLYKLAESLSRRGQTVRLWSWGETRQPGFEYLEELSPVNQDEDVVVYPEIVSGNPLQVRNVARWVLFFPGRLGGEKVYHPSEKIFTWSGLYYPGAPDLRPDVVDHDLFYDAGLAKTQDCVFVHKGGRWRQVPELEGLTEINMAWPPTRAELARLLQSTGTLYSFDAHSSLLDEAYYCGAAVKIITETGWRDFKPNLVFDPQEYERQLNYFINETQAMDYRGPLEPLEPARQARLKKYQRKRALCRLLENIFPGPFMRRKIARYQDKIRTLGAPF